MRSESDPEREAAHSGEFVEFFRRQEPPIRFALCASLGFEVGREATAVAFAHAWEHWGRVSGMENPVGYVFRVGQRAGRRLRRRPLRLPLWSSPAGDRWVEPALDQALGRLSERQRAAVVLVHGLDFTFREAGRVMGVSPSTVQKHVERALRSLRGELGVPT